MKRSIIITSLLAASLLTISAQEATPIDNVFRELQKFIHNGMTISKLNYGGKTSFRANFYLSVPMHCICGEGKADFDTTLLLLNESIEKQAQHNLSLIRHALDSISALPETLESYHFETHHQGIDTIRYSILLNSKTKQNKSDNGTKIRKFYNDRQNTYYYRESSGTETISFDYTTRAWPCGKHFNGYGTLRYAKFEATKTVPFEWKEYMQTIEPLLKHRDIIRREFKWLRNDSLGNTSDKDYIHRIMVRVEDGKLADGSSEMTGMYYFIPADKEELAQSVRHVVDSATQKYIHEHPSQSYKYTYGVNFPSRRPENSLVNELFTGNLFEHYVFLGSDVSGYYILFFTIPNGYVNIPEEWPVLKSFVNGKKVYYKEAVKAREKALRAREKAEAGQVSEESLARLVRKATQVRE